MAAKQLYKQMMKEEKEKAARQNRMQEEEDKVECEERERILANGSRSVPCAVCKGLGSQQYCWPC